MKTHPLVLLAMLLCLAHELKSQAWKDRSPEDKAQFFTRQMVNDLSLDDSLVMKVYAINLEVSKMFDSLYANRDKNDTRKGAAIIYTYRNEAFKKVLSTKEYLKFEDMERERREKRKKEQEEKQKKN
jgi:hypothetical protein